MTDLRLFFAHDAGAAAAFVRDPPAMVRWEQAPSRDRC